MVKLACDGASFVVTEGKITNITDWGKFSWKP